MILQIGSLFSTLGGFLKTSIEAVLPGGIQQLGSSALDIGRGLIATELSRGQQRRDRDFLKAQLRERSNLAGQGPAVPGQTAVPTGGRVFAAPFLIPNVIPPSPSPAVFRPVGLRAGPADRIAQRALKGTARQSLRLSSRLAGPLVGGAAALEGLLPAGPSLMQTVFPEGPSRMFLPGSRAARRAGLNGQIGSGQFPTLPQLQAGAMAQNGTGLRMRSVFQRTPDNCNVQHYVLPKGENTLQPIQNVLDTKGLPRFRLDITTGDFLKIQPRRMNPLNFRALSRARSRTGAALRVCRTMFTEARREKTGKIRPKRRAKRK